MNSADLEGFGPVGTNGPTTLVTYVKDGRLTHVRLTHPAISLPTEDSGEVAGWPVWGEDARMTLAELKKAAAETIEAAKIAKAEKDKLALQQLVADTLGLTKPKPEQIQDEGPLEEE